MHNIHGSRVNMDRLARKGSGYTAAHGPDFLMANDSWSQMINMRYGPDGGVFAIDWYDKNQCHSTNPDAAPEVARADLQDQQRQRQVGEGRPAEALVRPPRRDAAPSRTTGTSATRAGSCRNAGPNPAVHAALKKILRDNPDVTRKLRALWALHVTDGLTEAELLELFGQRERVPPQLGGQSRRRGQEPVSGRGAADDPARHGDDSPLVRLYVASAMQRVPATFHGDRWEIVTAPDGARRGRRPITTSR